MSQDTEVREVRAIANVWIPMSDGTRISARMWLPADADRHPVPAILEYIPYGKQGIAPDGGVFGELAARGYACVRADIRGSGESDGAPQDEYVPQEQDDALEIIAWMAEQEWCTGAVGMFGISWGGFNSLQIAARRPPALRAIITHCGSEDRYLDDVHYLNGCLNDGMFSYGSLWNRHRVLPPDPVIVGGRWRDQWLERLRALDFHVAEWLAHQRKDAFWRHASVSEDYGAIDCAVYAVGGWSDIYRKTVARLVAKLRCPRKGLVGPWGHQYPGEGIPGPRIDWLAESLRWWDHWLKGIDTGIMDEPPYRVWLQQEPSWEGAAEIRGRWIAEDAWPSARIPSVEHVLSDWGLGSGAGENGALVLAPSQAVGSCSPSYWFPGPDRDQRLDDARSLVFDSAPLTEPLVLFGAPSLELDLSIDRPVGSVVVRLNQLAPDGTSSRITFGVLNLTHRDSHEEPTALEPGRRYRVAVPVLDLAQEIPAGHRLRLTIAAASWPMIWPAPEPVTLTVHPADSRLVLPVRPPRPEDAALRPFGELPAGVAAPVGVEVRHDPSTGILTRRLEVGGSQFHEATGTEVTTRHSAVWTIADSDPTSARSATREAASYRRDGWDASCETELEVTSTRDEFVVRSRVVAREAAAVLFDREWERRIPRDLL